jgi:glycosyltransferase involved in cell wall biosynthesis
LKPDVFMHNPPSQRPTKPRIAYLVNHYPKVSHSFVRREIQALERLDWQVDRYALRGWNSDIVDPVDFREQSRTRFLLKDGAWSLLSAMATQFMSAPVRFLSALTLATRVGRRAERPLPLHWIYFAEACLLAKWLQGTGATHLHAHFGTNSAEVAMLTHALGGPRYSFTVHGPEEFDKPERLKLREKIERSAFVVAISSFGRSQLYRWIDTNQWHKVRTVHCGLDEAFHEGDVAGAPDVPRLVCVGRLCEQKGQLLLVQAVAQLVRAQVPIELVLAGDGEMRREIEGMISALKLQHHVRITGWIGGDQVRSEILAARALVLPSFAEGLPVVLMEAMALRRPVISTYVAGIPELVIDGENGWLVPAGDVDALQQAMRRCLAATPRELDDMGNRARARALSRHSIDTEAAKLAACFERPPVRDRLEGTVA